MKNSGIYILILVVLVAAGVYWYQTKGAGNNELMTNSETLKSERNLPIVTESNVNYFEGASGFFARPEAEGNYPGIVVIHENRGLRPEIRSAAEQLAKEGYMVLAVDLFGGRVVETQEDARSLTSNFDQEKGTQNMRAAVAYLRSKGATKVASLGWCFGGRQSIELATSGEKLDATVVYYGGGMATSTERLAPITWPVLGIFGDQDQVIPIEMVRAFETSLNTLEVPNEIYVYPGVGHAFANPSGMNYAPQETTDAWGKTLDFLKKYLE